MTTYSQSTGTFMTSITIPPCTCIFIVLSMLISRAFRSVLLVYFLVFPKSCDLELVARSAVHGAQAYRTSFLA